ncbi:MAG: signal peptidase I [Clostridium sp.]|jgi:signal peptidase|nr:signal peptidase I [Clostridium sp.]
MENSKESFDEFEAALRDLELYLHSLAGETAPADFSAPVVKQIQEDMLEQPYPAPAGESFFDAPYESIAEPIELPPERQAAGNKAELKPAKGSAIGTLKRLGDIVMTSLLLLSVLVVAAVGVLRFVFNAQLRAVTSGSMEPEIPVGALIINFPTDAKKIAVGDDVTFQVDGGEYVTHRVVSNTGDDYIITHGIANPGTMKEKVPYGSIEGVVRCRLPLAGYVLVMLGSPYGKAAAVIIFTLVVAAKLIVLIRRRAAGE